MIDQWKKGAKYWDKPWNPVIGCVPVSEGCEYCYAKRVVKKFGMNGGDFTPVFKDKKPPRKGVVFAGNMSDWFADFVPGCKRCDWLAQLSENATNLVLTKRAEMLENFTRNWWEAHETRHIWFGVTAENQEMADERIPHLLNAPIANRWLSLEPLLRLIHIEPCLLTTNEKRCLDNQYIPPPHDWQYSNKVKWVVVGAESGPDARPCKLEWIESIVEQCQEWNCPVFVKQIHIGGKLVTDIDKFPAHLRIRQVPWNYLQLSPK